MHFSHFITVALAVATGANAYAVDAFSGPNCTGNKQYVNIWDNTCGTWMNGFQSIRVVYFGSGNQNAHICRATSCHDCKKWNAGGRDPNWQKGVCINLGGGHNSMGSFTI